MKNPFISELAIAMARVSDPRVAEQFLQNILTPKELEEIALRLQIFKMLKKGFTQRTIAKKLGVSIGTISRGSREFQYGPRGIHDVLSKLEA